MANYSDTLFNFQAHLDKALRLPIIAHLWLDRVDGNDSLGIKTDDGVVYATTYTYEFTSSEHGVVNHVRGPLHYFAHDEHDRRPAWIHFRVNLLNNADTVPETVWKIRINGHNTVSLTIPRPPDGVEGEGAGSPRPNAYGFLT